MQRISSGLAVSLLALLVGCGGGDGSAPASTGSGSTASSDALVVSAAASLTEAFEAYGAESPGEVRFSFAGSDDLAAQIRQGAKPDVYAAASTAYPEALNAEGLVEPPVVFARNELVIAVGPDSDIDSIEDLAAPGLDLVVGAAGVPVGDYTRAVLDRLPAAERTAIVANVRSAESDVKGIVGKVAQGAADAGFVYSSDVAAAPEDLEAITLPPHLGPDVSYGIAVVVGAADPEAAQAFVDGLLDGAGSQALLDAGFRPPR